MISPCTIGKDQSVMKIEDIEVDPNPPQKGDSVTVTVTVKVKCVIVYSITLLNQTIALMYL